MNIEDVLLSHDIKPTLNRCEIMRILLECDFPLSIKDFESLLNKRIATKKTVIEVLEKEDKIKEGNYILDTLFIFFSYNN